MPEMSKAYVPEFYKDKNPNKKVLKLGQKITDRIGHKVTTEDPEYWGLRSVVDDEMATVALKMKVRHLYTFIDLKKMNKKVDEKHLQEILDKCTDVGLLEYNYGDHYDDNGPIKGAPHIRQYVLPMFVPGSAEFTNMKKKQLDEHPELAQFFERMTFLPLEKITHFVPEGGAGVGMHVIPVEKAIEMESKSESIEHISYWLKKYSGHISAGICSCRYGRSKLGENCGDNCEDWCLGLGDMADYCVETKKGHYITKERALEILQKAEDNGFVHQITNIDGKRKIFAICNCDLDICNALRTSQLFNTPNLSRSAYTAKVDPKNCVACGKCVENCPAGAVKLGQKLCLKDGTAVVYPKHELPDNLNWGKDKWSEDYREKNRNIECYDSGTSPCKVACPAHIAVQGYLKLASQGKYKEALALIKKDNPFPAVCGRICNKKCEDACTRGAVDKAVSIDAVKQFIAEQDLNSERRYVPEIVMPSLMGRWKEKIAIIGAGPAGLSAAYYLAQMGYYPTVYEKNSQPGGMLTYGIPEYKLDRKVIKAEIDILKEMGVEFKFNVEIGKDKSIEDLRKEGYKAFYLAIGCQNGKIPNINGKEAKGVTSAINFLKDACEHKIKKIDGEVVVVGGGNVAIDGSMVSSRLGAKKVSMYCLETEDIMPASKEEIAEARHDKVEINCGWGPKEVVEKDGKVVAIIFKKCLSVYDKDKKFNPTYDENTTIKVPCERVIFATGQGIEWGNLLKNEKVELNSHGYPIADPVTFETSVKDIFVGGDCYTGPKFVIDAIAEGKLAATSLHRCVQPGTSETIARMQKFYAAIDRDNIMVPPSYDNSSRQDEGINEEYLKSHAFKDPRITLTEEQVKIETKRCLGCGASIVDENKCIGCGICTTKCGFDAIHLFRTHPDASNMYTSEDKFKAIMPYMIKRAIKIKFGKKTPEEKLSQKKHKAYKHHKNVAE